MHALDALALLQTGAEEAARAETSRGVARLRLGTYPSVAARLLPPLLDRLAELCPEADVTLTESTSPEQLEQAVEAGRLDLRFTVQPFARPGVDGVALREDPFCLLVPRDSELAERRFRVALDELGGWPLILSGTCEHMRHLEARLRLRGHEPRTGFVLFDSVYSAPGSDPLPLVIGVSFTYRGGRWLALHNQDSQGAASPPNPAPDAGRR